MVLEEVKIRVRYGETDQMGYVYYGNYAQYYEVGRVELMRKLGSSYRKIEESGVMLPVLDFTIRYFKPAFYDDELTIVTRIEEPPGVRIIFHYQTINPEGAVLNEGKTTLAFVNRATGRPQPCPSELLKAIQSHFREK